MRNARFPSLAEAPLDDVLRLIRSEHVGPRTFFDLLHLHGTPAAALRQLEKLVAQGRLRKNIKPADPAAITREIRETEKAGAVLIPYGSRRYPPALLTLPDPPPLLIAAGNTDLLAETELLAMVGARNASENGCRYAALLADQLGGHGYGIVSGLARGIDAGAHAGALKHGTIGVIAGGIDTTYPPENRALYTAMREQGCILTEQPIGQQPFARAFPARNRIIAGMAQATLVIEATLRSGSLITARLAAEMGREVFAMPGFPLDPRCAGTNKLLKEGAQVLSGADDVVETLRGLPHFSLRESVSIAMEVPLAEMETQCTPEAVALPEEDLAARLLAGLGATPVLVDELLDSCQVSARDALAALLELELAGDIQRLPGNKVCRVFAEERI